MAYIVRHGGVQAWMLCMLAGLNPPGICQRLLPSAARLRHPGVTPCCPPPPRSASEYSALLGEPRAASVVAVEFCELFALSRWADHGAGLWIVEAASTGLAIFPLPGYSIQCIQYSMGLAWE